MNSSSQGRYWLLTIPHNEFLPYLPPNCVYLRGQLESGHNTGYLHWQLLVAFRSNTRLAAVKKLFGDQCHAELSRSAAADDYVWKLDTRVEGTQFELGKRAFKRNNQADWDTILNDAKGGRLDTIPSDILIRNYNNIRRITMDHLQPVALERQVKVYWGPTGVGKSRLAWTEATLDAYPKDPRTKFWDGYRGQENVVMDEFRGGIDICHLLRWFDRYPVNVEIKGAATTLKATKIWITSNIPPEQWYPELDQQTYQALLRRLDVTHMFIN